MADVGKLLAQMGTGTGAGAVAGEALAGRGRRAGAMTGQMVAPGAGAGAGVGEMLGTQAALEAIARQNALAGLYEEQAFPDTGLPYPAPVEGGTTRGRVNATAILNEDGIMDPRPMWQTDIGFVDDTESRRLGSPLSRQFVRGMEPNEELRAALLYLMGGRGG